MMQPHKHYLFFSNRQVKGILVGIVIIVVLYCLPYFFKSADAAVVIEKLDVMPDSTTENGMAFFDNDNINPAPLQLQAFNPNTVDSITLVKMGLRNKLIQTLLHYRQKGGKFYKPDDFKKLWGLRIEEANAIIPFIQIPEITLTKNGFKNLSNNNTVSVELNTATIEELKQVPGMPAYLAYAILRYREKLGAFVLPEQLKQVQGVNDSLYQLLLTHVSINNSNIPKLNLNSASSFALLHHSFIPENVAKAILILRQKEGPFQSINDLKKIPFISNETFEQIHKYCTVQ